MKRFLALAVVVASLCSLRAQAPAQGRAVDWERLRPEILERYRALVQIDTTAGHETLAVDYLKKVLEGEGIPTRTFALDPNRANLTARLKGNGSKRPLLILAHTDVVGVQRDKWPVDPFGAVMKDGYVWGRGSKDDKPVLAANLITMLMLKRLGVQLDRDVIFLAESGEEADVTGVGINYMVREHFAEIEAEFAMTEGGGARIDGARVIRVNIGTAEKLPARVRLVANGTAGHGSVPRMDNALIHSEAEATLDIRALPDEDVDRFYAEMAKEVADPAVKIVPLTQTRPPSPASKLETEMYRVMEQVARTVYPGAAVLPSMSTGASDQAQLRAKGIQSYGIGPASTESDALNYPAHGDVERLAESSLYPFVQYVWNVVTEVAAHK